MAFTFAAFCYIAALILTAVLIFFGKGLIRSIYNQE